MKKILDKGYTIKVVSWENDGDNYNTKKVTVETKEEVLALKALCMLSDGSMNHRGGLGNANKWTPTYIDLVRNFLIANTILIPDIEIEELEDDDVVTEIYSELTYDLLGSSGWYISRVCQSIDMYYLSEDIFAEDIN